MSLLLRCLLALSLVFAVSAPAQPQPQPQPRGATIAIVGADVLPMTGRERLRDQTILVRGDRIVAVGPRARVRIPADARRIQARGMTVMPGLVDMHVHLAPTPGRPGDPAQRAMAVMLAHGVTTARGMAGSPENLIVREAVERGTLAGPRFYAAAPGLHLNNTPSAEAGRQAVATAAAAGYDLIKSHHILDPAVWQAVQDEARTRAIPTAGHVANAIGLDRAMAARQQVEHLDGLLFALLPENAPERQIQFAQIPPPPVIDAVAAVTDAQIAALARRARAAGSWHVPTLSLFERIADVGTGAEQLMQRPEMRYVPDATLAQWSQQRAQMAQQGGYTPDQGRAFRDLRRRIVRAFHAAGVPMMAGSDTAQAFHIWGPGLHAEIRALHAAGLSRMDALRSATLVPRDYFRSLPNGGSGLGWRADFGTVTEGARADLILLSGDPSLDLAALDRPELVIAGGRAYDRATLDRMLDQASRDAKAQQPAPPAAPAAQALQQSVYVMRHLQAEQGQGQDPALTAQGQAQARQLVAFLGANRPAAIFATPYRRTQETAAPLAAALGLQVRTYDPANPQALMQALAAERGPAPVVGRAAGERAPILIIGHSNTVPDIVEQLGGQRPQAIAHDRFGDVWIVHPGGRTEHRRLP